MTGSTRDTVTAASAPAAVGPYSHAVRTDSLVFLSGQSPLDPVTGSLVDGDTAVQTERVFANLGAVLDAAGLSFDDVVKVNVFLTDWGDFAAMNHVYQQVFTHPYPARTTIGVAGLPLRASVEIELIAQA